MRYILRRDEGCGFGFEYYGDERGNAFTDFEAAALMRAEASRREPYDPPLEIIALWSAGELFPTNGSSLPALRSRSPRPAPTSNPTPTGAGRRGRIPAAPPRRRKS